MNLENLKKYSYLKGLNVGQAEKDYYQNLILFILYNKFSKEIVFKGGTALAKCYGLNRFSEDLDFTVREEKDYITIIDQGLNDFNIVHSIKEEKTIQNSRKYKIKINGPLYKGSERTLCSITVDLSFREPVVGEPNLVTIGYHMDVIPVFDVYVLKEEEIFAEKVRALMMRSSARDLYDLVFLLDKEVTPNFSLIEKKLELTNKKFSKKEFLGRCKNISSIWNNELKSLVKTVPSFEEYYKKIKDKID